MISPRDQTAFLSMTRPPFGFRLEYCVGSTFSLELDCLVQLALNSRSVDMDLDDVSRGIRLEIVEDFIGKTVVFCQNCRIQAKVSEAAAEPELRSFLSIFDGVIVPVRPPSGRGAFHPKVWLLKFQSNDKSAPPRYKLVVMSRNLTPSIDWDVAAVLIGEEREGVREENPALRRFLGLLGEQGEGRLNRKQKALIARAQADLTGVRFSTPAGAGPTSQFHFQWPGKKAWKPIDPGVYKELIVVSPFLGSDKRLLESLKTIPKLTLITGEQDVEILRGFPGIAENTFLMQSAPEAAELERSELGLHAKLYFGLRRGGKVDIWVGSANSTTAAHFGRNVEAMIHLTAPESILRSFESEFIYEKRGKKRFRLHPWLRPLKLSVESEIDKDNERAKIRKRLDSIRWNISMGIFEVLHTKGGKAEIGFSIPERISLPAGVGGSFRLLGMEKGLPLTAILNGERVEGSFAGGEASDFVIITLESEGESLSFWTVARSNLDRGGRSQRLLKAGLADHNALIEFLGFLLGDEVASGTDGGGGRGSKKKKRRKRRSRSLKDGFLEMLLLRSNVDDVASARIDKALALTEDQERSDSERKDLEIVCRIWRTFKEAKKELEHVG